MKNTIFVAMLLWLVSVAVPGTAQVDTGTLVGTITDANGAAVAGATATATELDTGVKTSAQSDSNGNYAIRPIKIGRYALSVEAKGFQKEIRQNIVLNVLQTMRLDFSLKGGSVITDTVIPQRQIQFALKLEF